MSNEILEGEFEDKRHTTSRLNTYEGAAEARHVFIVIQLTLGCVSLSER